MKNAGMPRIMWLIYKKQYEKGLALFQISNPREHMRKVAEEYERILAQIPDFGKEDVLLINLLSAAAVAAVYQTLPQRPSVEQMAAYYRHVMDAGVTRIFLKASHQFSARYQQHLKKQAEKSQRATNTYTWRFTYHPGETLDRFDAIFDKCGICELYKHLGIPELTPALCAYDYDMAKTTGTIFTRAYTIASGGPVCDCHYQRETK